MKVKIESHQDSEGLSEECVWVNSGDLTIEEILEEVRENLEDGLVTMIMVTKE